MSTFETRKYPVSETSLEAEWVKDRLSFHSSHHCSNCGNSFDAGYPARSFKLGEFCSKCGARMKNPQWITIEYDYD
jgi:rRNA maturation protein Nop10